MIVETKQGFWAIGPGYRHGPFATRAQARAWLRDCAPLRARAA